VHTDPADRLTKKGEHLSTWRKRWFVLKDKRLGWFKAGGAGRTWTI